MIQRREQWLSLRRGTVNAPMSKFELLEMTMLTSFVAADLRENRCLASPGTIVTGSCPDCLESRWPNT